MFAVRSIQLKNIVKYAPFIDVLKVNGVSYRVNYINETLHSIIFYNHHKKPFCLLRKNVDNRVFLMIDYVQDYIPRVIIHLYANPVLTRT